MPTADEVRIVADMDDFKRKPVANWAVHPFNELIFEVNSGNWGHGGSNRLFRRRSAAFSSAHTLAQCSFAGKGPEVLGAFHEIRMDLVR